MLVHLSLQIFREPQAQPENLRQGPHLLAYLRMAPSALTQWGKAGREKVNAPNGLTFSPGT